MKKIKFCLVGLANMACDYGIFYLITLGLNLHYSLAQAGGYLAALICSYNLNKQWTFREPGVVIPPFKEAGWRFLASNAVSFSVSLGILALLSDYGSISWFTAKLIAGSAAWIMNYFFFRYFAFRGYKPNHITEKERPYGQINTTA